MASHNGVKFDAEKDLKANYFSPYTYYYLPTEQFLKGTQTQVTSIPLVENELGKRYETAEELCIYDKQYLDPELLEYDLLTEETVEDIILWNAHLEHVSVTNISGVDSGLELEHPTVPFLLTAESEEKMTLTIKETGPAIQNSTITFSLSNGRTKSLIIKGSRISSFPFIITYKPFKMTYNIKAISFFNDKKFVEQRRPLYSQPIRTQEVSYIYNNYEAQFMINRMRSLINRVLGVAIYSQPLTFSGDVQGLSNITVNEIMTYYWDLSQLDYVILIRTDIQKSELKEIISYSDTTLNLKYPVSGEFNGLNTKIYPAMVGIIDNKSIDVVTEDVTTIDITFKETRL